MPAFRTAFQGYSVKFSPFEEGKLAVATSQNFGIIGNGKQYVLQVRHHSVGRKCTAVSMHCRPVQSLARLHNLAASRTWAPLLPLLLSRLADGPCGADGVARV